MGPMATGGVITKRLRRGSGWHLAAIAAAALMLTAGTRAASADLHVALHWNSARLPPSMADAMKAETTSIWTALGVTLVWEACVPDRSTSDGLVLVVTDGVSASAPSGRARLGEVTFVNGRPGARLHVSAGAALDAIEEAALRGGPFMSLPVAGRHDAAVRLLGRAAAHELGHYLLGSAAHAPVGLMRPAFTAEEGLAHGLERYGLDRGQLERIRDRFGALAQTDAAAPMVTRRSGGAMMIR